jgi:hypothetical protein
VDPADPLSAPLAARLAPSRYDPDRCAVHTTVPDPSGS